VAGDSIRLRPTETHCTMPANGYSGPVEARNGMNGMDDKTCRTDASHKLVHIRPRSARHEGVAWGESAEVVAIAESSRCSEKSKHEGLICVVPRCSASIPSCLIVGEWKVEPVYLGTSVYRPLPRPLGTTFSIGICSIYLIRKMLLEVVFRK
jgi:hypothetical protein